MLRQSCTTDRVPLVVSSVHIWVAPSLTCILSTVVLPVASSYVTGDPAVVDSVSKNMHAPNRRSPIALFMQVHDVLLGEFESGVWQAGNQFPSLSELT